MTEQTVRDQVDAALKAMGDTAEQVAETLRAAGIKGRPAEGCGCPIYRYLIREFPQVTCVTIFGVEVLDGGKATLVELPLAVEIFIYNFETFARLGSDRYADLVEVFGA